MKPATLLALLLLPLAACSRGPLVKAALDEEVRRLCAIDGGVVIYEHIKISREEQEFLPTANGRLSVAIESLAHPRAPVFARFTDHERLYDRDGAKIGRHETQIIRRADGRVIAKKVFYVRSGGDIPSHAFPSSFYCPSLDKLSVDTSEIFILGESEK